MKLDNTQQAFLSLVKAGLWGDAGFMDSRNHGFVEPVDWEVINRLAEDQSVIGVVLAGLEHSNVKPSQDLLLQWIGEVQLLEQQNKAMNQFVAQLITFLRKNEVFVLLVKGQGIGQCYERPLWRVCGDVDLLVDKDNYKKAKDILLKKAEDGYEEDSERMHLSMMIENWAVELHGTMHGGWSKRVDQLIDVAQDNCFKSGIVRTWRNGETQVFLPSPDNDLIFVFTHILQHFFVEGIGLRQICDWCRLIWKCRGDIDLRLLEKRLTSVGLMPKWKAFAALAVEYLGMDSQTMPFYSAETKWKKKADRLLGLIMETGNFGFARDKSYKQKHPLFIRYVISFYRHTSDMYRKAMMFPKDSVISWCRTMIRGVVK